ncbi:MAG TPA: aromatic-ring-hydroxylating dioxygenase subunit beta [Dehalococcoidia bacterium]|nr:aromatic-ring-hydroxylating dioxygenase subunit beta [Dehalococcoidia bacterium]
MAIAAKIDRQEIENFLYKEARLIDDGKFDEWLELFAEDAIYWAPCNRYDIDPNTEVSLIYDDKSRMRDRVWRLQSGLAYSQEPASRVRHMLSNMELVATEGDAVTISSNFGIFEVRKGVQKTYAGRVEHHLRREGEGWKIAFKKVELLNNDDPIDNLTFLV